VAGVTAEIVGVLLALVALAWVVAAPRVARRFFVPAARPGAGTASASVVVAVHDEAPRVARLVASLRAQDHPDFEVVVVDDRSGDGTAEVAREAIGDDPRMCVVGSVPRPPGWQGRLWAQGQGVECTRKGLLVFPYGDQEIASPASCATWWPSTSGGPRIRCPSSVPPPAMPGTSATGSCP